MATPEEIKALEQSIEHWRDVTETSGFEVDSDRIRAAKCACCLLQAQRQGRGVGGFTPVLDCFHETGNCVIAEYTEQESCYGTPYYKVRDKKEHPRVMLDWLRGLHKYLTGQDEVGPGILVEDDEP